MVEVKVACKFYLHNSVNYTTFASVIKQKDYEQN